MWTTTERLTDVGKAAAPLFLGQSTVLVVVTRSGERRDASRLRLVSTWLQREEFTVTEVSVKVRVQMLKLPAHRRLASALICDNSRPTPA